MTVYLLTYEYEDFDTFDHELLGVYVSADAAKAAATLRGTDHPIPLEEWEPIRLTGQFAPMQVVHPTDLEYRVNDDTVYVITAHQVES